MLTLGTAVSAFLDCVGSNDFEIPLPVGTTWLKPCVLKLGSRIINSLAGPTPLSFTNPYSLKQPKDSLPTSSSIWTDIYTYAPIPAFLASMTMFLTTICVILLRKRGDWHPRWRGQATPSEAGPPQADGGRVLIINNTPGGPPAGAGAALLQAPAIEG